MQIDRQLFLLKIAATSVLANKMRGMLTALGVVFGVAAVIAMLAIGTGAKKFILDQMRLIGTNNIVITQKDPGKKSDDDKESNTTSTASNDSKLQTWAPGMSVSDIHVMQQTIPSIELISPEIIRETKAIFNGKILDIRCVGVYNTFFSLNQLSLSKGAFFSEAEYAEQKPVCIIGKNIETKLFSGTDPIGELIKCGNHYFTVIGVLDKRYATKETLSALGLRDYNSDVYIPLDVSLVRFGDRSAIQKDQLAQRGDNREQTKPFNQLDRLVIRVADSRYLRSTADIVSRLLKRMHQGKVDFTIEIPELLLEQQQKTQNIFNMVLAVIAGISLLVGGIGIMNIMLASVYERIKEIGLRRAIGATGTDVVVQFLFEAILVSIIGGVVGVFLGMAAAHAIASAAEIPTIITWWSVLLSFGVAASIGLLFGIFPARKAARMDPIEALRTE